MADINELRREIDAADKEITKLFLHRMEVCRDIGEYKAKRNLPVLDEEREKQLLEKAEQFIGMLKKHLPTIIQTVREEYPQVQFRFGEYMGTSQTI